MAIDRSEHMPKSHRKKAKLWAAAGVLLLSGCAGVAQSSSCRVLITNDDGVDSPGISALNAGLADLCDVVVAAPSEDRSGASHSIINTSQGTRVTETTLSDGTKAFAVHGSPAEAVAVGLKAFASDGAFDLVVSGINYGDNTGIANLYSGTVNAAMEAVVRGVPAIAISQSREYGDDFSASVALTRRIVTEVLQRGLPDGVMLNVNVPKPIAGVDIVKSSSETTVDLVGVEAEALEPGTVLYKPVLEPLDRPPAAGDARAYLAGSVVIAPLQLDRTAYDAIDELKRWNLDFEQPTPNR